MPDLAVGWHVYAPDLRGHGKSERASGRYRLQDYANDVVAFLRQQLDVAAAVIGHSLGGMIALLVAAQCPDCVRAVVVGDAPLSAETWRALLDQDRDRLALWRDLAGGRYPLEEVVAAILMRRQSMRIRPTQARSRSCLMILTTPLPAMIWRAYCRQFIVPCSYCKPIQHLGG